MENKTGEKGEVLGGDGEKNRKGRKEIIVFDD